MKETGIIMSGNHPKLILDGIKTQTRRVIKPQPDLLYGIYDDIIQLYHNRRSDEDGIDFEAYTNISNGHLYGWERWEDLLKHEIQGIWQKGFRGVVSVSWLPNGKERLFNCILMPRQQANNNVSSSLGMYGFSRDATKEINASEAFGWQPTEQQTRESKMGNSIRQLVRQNNPQSKQSELQQSQFKNHTSRTGTYPLGSQDRDSQQTPYIKGVRHKPALYFRNMPYNIASRLWVREKALYWDGGAGGCSDVVYIGDPEIPILLADNDRLANYRDIMNTIEGQPVLGKWIWKPSIHMPRWASRITLEITGIRVERLEEITTEDAIDEGCLPELAEGTHSTFMPARGKFRLLWDSLNAKRGCSWESNPWVWVISFKKL